MMIMNNLRASLIPFQLVKIHLLSSLSCAGVQDTEKNMDTCSFLYVELGGDAPREAPQCLDFRKPKQRDLDI